MISAKVAAKVTDVIDTALRSLGMVNGTKMPKTDGNTASVAWEFMLATEICRVADARFKLAEKAAQEAGIIFDAKTRQEELGKKIFYRDENVLVFLEVKKPGSQVRAQIMFDYLAGKGVALKLLNEAKIAATIPNRPSHTFSVMINEQN